LTFGVIGFGFMIFAALLGARKRVPDVADWAGGRRGCAGTCGSIAELAHDFVSRRISFWRDADAGADVAADHYGGERIVWRGAAALRAAGDGPRIVKLETIYDEIGNVRKAAAGRGGSRRKKTILWDRWGSANRRRKEAQRAGGLQRGADNGDKQRRRGKSAAETVGAERRGVRAFAKIFI